MKVSSKILSILLYIFYAFVIIFIIGFIYYNVRDKEYFFLNNDNVDMIVDSEYQVNLVGRNGSPNYSNYEFISENENIAVVDSNGKVKAISEGQTSIIVKSKKYDFEDKISVNIEGDSLYSISFYSDDIIMKIGESYKPTVLVNGSSKMNIDVVWKSSNNKVATINNGTIKAISSGVAYIEATIKDTNYSTKLKVTVQEKESPLNDNDDKDETEEYEAPDETVNDYVGVSSIEILSKIDGMSVSEEKNIEYRILPENASNKKVTWNSSDPSVVSVDNNGHIKALKQGHADITIRTEDGNKKVFISIDVNDSWTKVNDIILNKYKLSLYEGSTGKLTATISPSNATNKSITWSSSNTDIAVVDQNGKVTGKKPGTVKITASSSNDVKTICNVEVKKKVIAVESIKIKEQTSLIEGGSEKLKVTFVPNNATNKKITWSSSNTDIAVVDSNGKVTAKKSGTVVIIAKSSNNKTSKCTVVIDKKIIEVAGVSLDKKSITLEEERTTILNASVTPKNATDQNIVFESKNLSVATVDQDGKVTAIKEGNTQIVARSTNGKEAVCNITVEKKKIYATEIKLDKTALSIPLDGTYTLKATILPNNTTDKKVVWSSSNRTVALVDSNGKITPIKVGSTTITAKTSNGKIATCEVTITKIKIQSITLNTSNTILEKGKTKTVKVSITPSNASNNSIKWTSSNTAVASVDENGNVKALSYGQTTIKASAQDGSGKSASFVLIVKPVGNMIDIRKSTYKVYASAVGNLSKHIQNFAISNPSAAKPVIYLSTVEAGNATSSKASLTNSIVYKYTKTSKTAYSSGGIMYLKKSGHGQSFEIEPNSDIMWINAYGEPYASGGLWWGGNNGIQRIKFKKNNSGNAITPLYATKFVNGDNKPYMNLQPSIDQDNDLIMFASKKLALIYKYSDLKNGKKTLVYKVSLSSKIADKYGNGSTIYNQGLALKNGFIYQFRGAPGKLSYIEVFNLMGVSQYVLKLNNNTNHKGYINRSNVEPEGIRIYNNRIFVGTTYRTNNGGRFDIGYF